MRWVFQNQLSGLSFTGVYGDITTVHADSVVTGEGPDFLGESYVTKSLIKAYPKFKDVRNQMKQKHRSLKLWTVETSVLDGQFKYVFHAVLVKGDGDQWVRNMKTLYHRIFDQADRMKVISIVVPLLGAGAADTSRSLSVKAVVTSVLTYSPKCLNKILLVSNDMRVLDSLRSQLQREQSGIQEPTSFFTKIFNFFSSNPQQLYRDDHWKEERQIHEALQKSKEENQKQQGLRKSREEDNVNVRFNQDSSSDGTWHPSSNDYSDFEIIGEEEISATISEGKDVNTSGNSDQNINGNDGETHPCDNDADVTCPICLCVMDEPKKLEKCGHIFCKACIDQCFRDFKPVCPSCNMVYGIILGNQPEGTMDVGFSSQSLPGYKDFGTITITYYFPSGIQEERHPNPGQPYRGTTRRAYLPDCTDGKAVLKLLKIAYDRKLTFTIGRSTTTGRDNVVTWNDIHHKTNMDGGPTRFGYPDPTYLSRVRDELSNKGVTDYLENSCIITDHASINE